MALMAVGPSRNAQVVTAPPSVPERLAQAQDAEDRPRSRVGELQAAFDEALAAKRYGEDTVRLQNELHEARIALVEAEAVTRSIREGIAAAERAQAAERKAVDDARRHEEAQRVIGDAIAGEKRARDGIEECLAEMRASLDAACDAWRRAQAWEGKVRAEQQRVLNSRADLGEIPPGQRAPGANRASVLADHDPLVRELTRWRGQWRG
jgi:hypothetical protein